MCGIAGSFRSKPTAVDAQAVANAISTMRKRGPNDRGVNRYDSHAGVVWLAHARLSVIDLSSAGHQPMHSADGRYSVVFNGEIYNYLELREQLVADGVRFHTGTDTEVLLAAWTRWGSDALTRFVGMFAFGIFDRRDNVLTCVRDPFGIKPLFYAREGKDFLFASELGAIKALKNERRQLNWQRAYDYLLHGDYDSNESSFLQGVYHLMPGHLLRLNLADGALKLERWWTPKVSPVSSLTFVDAAEALREKFLASVRLHLRSDVALGAALSGGVDSSAIVCAMRHLEPDAPIHTFSFVARGSKVSEEHWVDLVNTHVGATAHKIDIQPSELARDLDDMIATQGEPFGSTSIYAQYRVFQLAKEQGITVTLDGQGADELLAGYSGYPGQRTRSLLDQHRYPDAWTFLRNWAQWPGRLLLDGVKATVAECIDGRLYDWLRQANGAPLRPAWLRTAALQEAGVQLRFPVRPAQFALPGRRLIAELATATTRRGLPALLRHGDRNSMRFSVESRVPFLTAGLADFLLTLPEHYLISQRGETKSVLRAAMRGIVPDQVLDRRDKIGFATPEQHWLTQMAPQVREWLREDTHLPFLNQKHFLKEFDAIVAGGRPFSWQVWRWINFTRWYNRHMVA